MWWKKWSRRTNGPRGTWNTSARLLAVAGTSRPTKAHFNWEIRYEPPQLAAVSDTAVGCDKGGIDPLGGLKLQEVFDSDSYSTASGTASVAAGAAKRESGLQVDMSNQKLKTPISMDKPKGGGMGISVVVKEPMAKKPLGTGASIIVKERRVLLNKDTYRKLFEKYYDKHGKWISGMKVPPCKRCKAFLHPDEPAHVCEGFVPQYNDDVDWEQKEYDRQASLDEMRAEAREAPEDMDEDEICSEDDAEEYSEKG